MKDTKHTQGPWRVGRDCFSIVSKNGRLLLEVPQKTIDAIGEPMAVRIVAEAVKRYNAHDELLAALESACERLYDLGSFPPSDAEAAIAKAKGEA